MKTLLRCLLPFLAVLAAGPAPAVVGVPDLFLSEAALRDPSGQVLTLMVLPDGGGPGFDGAVDPLGNPADATVEMVVRDPLGYPIFNFPFLDLWLEMDAADPGLAVCHPFNPGAPFAWIIADANTDIQGRTRWSSPPEAGGYGDVPVFAVINGERLRSNAGLALRFNSPDINGDRVVNLADVVILARDFHGAYHFRSDLAHDGVINLSDVAAFAPHVGTGCP